MERTIVGVNFMNKKTNEFGGKTYNYFCDLEVKVGDIVKVSTTTGDSVAKVYEVNVPADSIPPQIQSIMKTITAFAESQEG